MLSLNETTRELLTDACFRKLLSDFLVKTGEHSSDTLLITAALLVQVAQTLRFGARLGLGGALFNCFQC